MKIVGRRQVSKKLVRGLTQRKWMLAEVPKAENSSSCPAPFHNTRKGLRKKIGRRRELTLTDAMSRRATAVKGPRRPVNRRLSLRNQCLLE